MALWALIALCTAAAVSDLRRRRVSNALNLSIFGAGLGYQVATGGLAGLTAGLIGAGIGLGILFLPFACRWLGAGDVKLAASLGAWLGPSLTLSAVLLGLAGGGLLAVVIAARHSILRSSVQSALLSLATRMPPLPDTKGRLAVPLALPLAAAGVVVFALQGGVS